MSESRITRRGLLCSTAGLAAAAMAGRWTAQAAEEPAGGEMIWDCHGHLSGVAGTVEQRVDEILKYADRMGIQRLVICMGTQFTYVPTPAQLRQQNDEVLRAVAHAPDRLLGFVYLSPKLPEESLGELERCVHNGPMVGIKLWVAAVCTEPRLEPVIARAAELKIPILQHTFFRFGGNLPGESNPSQVAELAAKHPDVSFICAHCGADWELGVRAVRAVPNVLIDCAGFDPTVGWIEMAVRELGPERVVYGSDYGGRSFASQLAKVYSADITPAARRLILGANLKRLLTPIFTAKGMKT